MATNISWGGNASVVLILVVLSSHLLGQFPAYTWTFGGFACLLIFGLFLILIAVPTISIQVGVGVERFCAPLEVF